MKIRQQMPVYFLALLMITATALAAGNYSYNNDIKSLMNLNGCVECHSSWAGSYDTLMEKVSGNDNTFGVPIIYTAAAKADSSVLVWRLEGKLPGGSTIQQMPAGSDALSSSDIQIVKDWIDSGAPEEKVAVEHKAWGDIKKNFK